MGSASWVVGTENVAEATQMPILGKETSVFPDDLFERDFDESSERVWRAAFTKSRQEKSLARHLEASGIPFFLPLVSKDNRIRGKRVTSHIPLFTGYVFLHATEDERVRSLTTNRISTILPVADQRQLFMDLRQVRQLIDIDAPLTVERRLVAGQRVCIKHGAMAGLEGTITTRRGTARLLVAVQMLQSGVSVEIDDYMVEPL